jgi:hypothetical protein
MHYSMVVQAEAISTVDSLFFLTCPYKRERKIQTSDHRFIKRNFN